MRNLQENDVGSDRLQCFFPEARSVRCVKQNGPFPFFHRAGADELFRVRHGLSKLFTILEEEEPPTIIATDREREFSFTRSHPPKLVLCRNGSRCWPRGSGMHLHCTHTCAAARTGVREGVPTGGGTAHLVWRRKKYSIGIASSKREKNSFNKLN